MPDHTNLLLPLITGQLYLYGSRQPVASSIVVRSFSGVSSYHDGNSSLALSSALNLGILKPDLEFNFTVR